MDGGVGSFVRLLTGDVGGDCVTLTSALARGNSAGISDMDRFLLPLTLLSNRTLQPGLSPIQKRLLVLNSHCWRLMSDIDTLVLSTEGDALTSGKRRNGRAANIARIDYLGENAAASPTCDRPFSKTA
jgi:hypothetical protein